jgi:NADH dehydrogenase FAD-containing subunit/uncharacterized membrane protein YphA (DoxX/SURF4 family)
MSTVRDILRPGLSQLVDITSTIAGTAGPWLMLATRVWLCQAFLTHQIAMLMAGQSLTATLSSGWWSEIVAQTATSGFGGLVQAVCPLLLAAGFLGRPAAAAMLLQTLFLRMPGQSAGSGEFWSLLLLGVIVFGPGPLSLDRLFRPAARSAALPGLAAVLQAYASITKWAGPIYLLALRAAIAGTMLAWHDSVARPLGMIANPYLPSTPGMIAGLPEPVALGGALLLALGLMVRPTALVLALLTPLDATSSVLGDRLYWLLLLALLFVRGGDDELSLDQILLLWLRRGPDAPDIKRLPHVVIVGGGFGGIAAASGLRTASCRVTLIDRRNYHLFQPLLYQVATASLSPADIATPIRGMLRTQPNLRVLLGEVTGVDIPAREVCLGASRIGYDTLVLATGARHSYFGRDEWSGLAPGLKTIDDATFIRRNLLLAFETAEDTDDMALRAAWLTFVIVGGGPTGVELAGAIAELARFGMEGEFRAIDPADARVVLVQSAPVLLPSFPASLSTEAARALRHLGVELHLGAKVEQIDTAGVIINGEHLPARTVLWAAGVRASPASAWLGVAPDSAGRVPVGPDLRVAGCGEVFAIGDTALSNAWNGRSVPGLAPAAKQGGAYVARVVRARLRRSPSQPPFRYRHFGSLATIGREAAVAEFGRLRFKGALAWWVWGAAHIVFLVGGRNRAAVILHWLWDYLTFRRGTRLITGVAEPES